MYGSTGYVCYGGCLFTSAFPPTRYPSSLQLPLPLYRPLPSRRSRARASAIVLYRQEPRARHLFMAGASRLFVPCSWRCGRYSCLALLTHVAGGAAATLGTVRVHASHAVCRQRRGWAGKMRAFYATTTRSSTPSDLLHRACAHAYPLGKLL